MIRSALLGSVVAFSLAVPSIAAEAPPLTPAAAEQIVLAETLARYGEARKDPVLLIAAARIAKGISAEGPAVSAKIPSVEEMLASAVELSDNDEVIKAMADDVRATQSKGYCYGSYGLGWC